MLAKTPPRDEASRTEGPPVSGLALQLGASPPTSPAPKRASAVRGPSANGEDIPVRIALSFSLFFHTFFFISIKKLFIPTPGTVGQHDASVVAKQPETQGSRGVGRGGSNETRALWRIITRRGTAHGKRPPCLSFFSLLVMAWRTHKHANFSFVHLYISSLETSGERNPPCFVTRCPRPCTARRSARGRQSSRGRQHEGLFVC